MVVFVFSSLASIFAIMNPIANVPIFMVLTANQSQAEQRILARRSVIVAFLIVMFFAILGPSILNFLGITLDAFRIAGGILLSGEKDNCVISGHRETALVLFILAPVRNNL